MLERTPLYNPLSYFVLLKLRGKTEKKEVMWSWTLRATYLCIESLKVNFRLYFLSFHVRNIIVTNTMRPMVHDWCWRTVIMDIWKLWVNERIQIFFARKLTIAKNQLNAKYTVICINKTVTAGIWAAIVRKNFKNIITVFHWYMEDNGIAHALLY